MSWNEYSNRYFDKRKDVIYTYDTENNEMIWHENPYHNNEMMRKTDCGDNIKDYANIKQVIISDEYYLFKAGNKLPELITCRDYTLKNGIRLIKDYMEAHADSYEYRGVFNDEEKKTENLGCRR